jgi:hypothetical protein
MIALALFRVNDSARVNDTRRPDKRPSGRVETVRPTHRLVSRRSGVEIPLCDAGLRPLGRRARVAAAAPRRANQDGEGSGGPPPRAR